MREVQRDNEIADGEDMLCSLNCVRTQGKIVGFIVWDFISYENPCYNYFEAQKFQEAIRKYKEIKDIAIKYLDKPPQVV